MCAAAVWTTASTLVEPVDEAGEAMATVSMLKRREKDQRWSGEGRGSTQATSATGRGWSGREWRVVRVVGWIGLVVGDAGNAKNNKSFI